MSQHYHNTCPKCSAVSTCRCSHPSKVKTTNLCDLCKPKTESLAETLLEEAGDEEKVRKELDQQIANAVEAVINRHNAESAFKAKITVYRVETRLSRPSVLPNP